jgi:pyruvate formate lyase activating enzyme
METRRPLVVEIKRGSLEDGPGIRTVVFLKGCPLRCVFCHNPEAQESGPELAFAKRRCIECGRCAGVCPRAAIDLLAPFRVDRARCDLCGTCAEICPAGALRLVGTYWPADELAELLLRDAAFYRHSHGGVTFSGGECTMFPDYLQVLLQRLKESEVHVALETSGLFDYSNFAGKILPHVDLVMFDVKVMDRAASARYLGQPSDRIHANLRRLLREPGVQVLPRVPLIPGITDSAENLAAIVDALGEWGAGEVVPLPYNPLGIAMYAQLGRPDPELPAGYPQPEREKEVLGLFREIAGSRQAT